MKLEYRLGNVHCAGCASALEEILQKIEGVKSASLNFISNLLVLEINDHGHNEIKENVTAAIKKFDKRITLDDPHKEEKRAKKQKVLEILEYVSLAVSFAIVLTLFFVDTNNVLELCLYIFAYLIVGYKVLWQAFINLFKGKMLDENFLMTIATVGAFAIGEFTEAVAVMIFYLIGEIFQNKAVKRSEKAIKSIAQVKAEYATLVLDNTEMQVTLEKVSVGDIIRVKPGERVPLDGKVIEGACYVDTKALTGESQERYLKVNDEILSGMIVTNETILVKVTALEHESTVSKIIELVEKSSNNKSKTEKFISRFAKYYTPIVVGLALVLAFIVPIFSLYQNFSQWLYRALVFLVVSCPCALVISVPLTFFAGIGAAARNGILVKGANYLEILSGVSTVIFDKTGTLTLGNFKISNIVAYEDKEEEEILEFVAYAENFSNHRIAKSIVEEYKLKTQKDINVAWINGAAEIAGEGVQANIFGVDCLVGNRKLMTDNNVVGEYFSSPNTIIYLAQNGTLAGYIEIVDQVKPEAKTTVEALREQGVKTVSMFTGDNEQTAKAVAMQVGVDCYHAELLPVDKVKKLDEHEDNKTKLAFVGDGINDAVVLSTVDVGIAMGGVGSDIAIESADVVIIDDDLSRIPLGISISKKTKRIVTENIVFALGIKALVLVLSTLGIANMWLGVFADVGVSLLAVLNSLRALIVPKRYKKNKTLDKTK